MKTPKRFYNLEQDGITQGLLSIFLTCRYKARHFLQGWSPRSISMGLTFGTITHGVLEEVYREIYKGRLRDEPFRSQITSYISKVEGMWRKDNPRADRRSLENLELSLAIAEATLPVYFKYWHKDFRNIKWKKVENSFATPYTTSDGRKTILRGKMDGVFESPKLWLMETKSKSIIVEADLVDLLPFEFQILFYLSALRKMKLGRSPSGVLYNIIRRSNLRRGKKESLQKFAKRCADDVQERPEHYFIRLEIAITSKETDNFEAHLDDLVIDFMNWWEGKSGHYRNTGQCITKYGKCPYLGVCSGAGYTYLAKREKVYRELSDY